MLKEIKPQDIPVNTIKLMGVDPAGKREDGKGDNWAMAVVGVEPNMDELGASNFYILDLFIDRLEESDAPYTCAQMYLRGGMIQMLGVEKVGQSTAEIHIANALKKHSRHLSLEARNLMVLKPAKREKAGRIEKGWSYLLKNGKIHISTKIDPAYRNKLIEELDDFPYASNDDGSDILAYMFKDMMQNYDVRALMETFMPQEHVDLRGNRRLPLNQRTGGTSWASR
jgi:phage terminase large subunit-like protein